MRTRIAAAGVATLMAGASLSASSPARAQQTPPQGSTPGDDSAPLVVPTELVKSQPGGLTAERVGERAGATSWNAKASEETMRGAAARVDEAWAGFLPRLSGIAKYTRLSDFTPPSLGSGSLAATTQPAGSLINGVTPQNPLFAAGLSFPLVLNNWLLQGTVTVPISDYFLRIEQSYTSATRSQDAARWDVITARTASAANGRAAYYTWLRARGAVIVAVQALNDQKTHVRDARNQFQVGNASKADVLRAETAMASADLALERAKNLADLTEKQLRVAIHAQDEEGIVPGEDLEAPLASVPGNAKQMVAEAISSRPEIKSADANADAAREQVSVARASRYPVLSGFADIIGANPNPRYIPQSNDWHTTWDVGAQLTWSPNDTLTANGSTADAESRAAAIEANKNVVRDNIEIEVTQDLQGVHEADFSIEASMRELTSAEEAYRVQRELFNNGRGTSTTLTDAETDLTRARLDLLNAKADARIARIRLEHALGRDVRPAAR